MEIRYGPTEDGFRSIVAQVGMEHYGDNLRAVDAQAVRTLRDGRNVIRGRVRAKTGGYAIEPRNTDYLAPGARRFQSGRRGGAACWHAYRDVLAELFRRYPQAVVLTGMARYDGKEGFERSYPETAYVNVGSQTFPTTMPELCDCSYMYDYGNELPRERAEPNPLDTEPEPTNDYEESQLGEQFDLFPDITARIAAVERELTA